MRNTSKNVTTATFEDSKRTLWRANRLHCRLSYFVFVLVKQFLLKVILLRKEIDVSRLIFSIFSTGFKSAQRRKTIITAAVTGSIWNFSVKSIWLSAISSSKQRSSIFPVQQLLIDFFFSRVFPQILCQIALSKETNPIDAINELSSVSFHKFFQLVGVSVKSKLSTLVFTCFFRAIDGIEAAVLTREVGISYICFVFNCTELNAIYWRFGPGF